MTKQDLINWWHSKDNKTDDYNDLKDFWANIAPKVKRVEVKKYVSRYESNCVEYRVWTERSRFSVDFHFILESGEAWLIRY